MIGGVGTDLISISRVNECYERFGKRFVSRILSPAEQQLFGQLRSKTRMIEWLAGRFAAKEAVAKAWGTGIGEQLSFAAIEVLPNSSGKPIVRLPDRIVFPALGVTADRCSVHLSITHSETHAMAFAVLEIPNGMEGEKR